jgi:hypothetical protein
MHACTPSSDLCAEQDIYLIYCLMQSYLFFYDSCIPYRSIVKLATLCSFSFCPGFFNACLLPQLHQLRRHVPSHTVPYRYAQTPTIALYTGLCKIDNVNYEMPYGNSFHNIVPTRW